MNKYTETKKKIYTTTDYEAFKFLDGNRDVKNSRVIKAMESIEEYGWLTQPILVNEKLEVIDGQGRLEALRRLGMPVEFVIDEGIGINECKALNVYQKNWNISDYINAYASSGDESYQWIKKQLKSFSSLPKATIFNVSIGMSAGKCLMCGDGGKIMKRGEFSISHKNAEKVEDTLFYLSRFVETAKMVRGRTDVFYSAIYFISNIDGVDRERLAKTINNARYEIVSAGTIEAYLTMMESFYNKGLKKEHKVDFMHEYKIA